MMTVQSLRFAITTREGSCLTEGEKERSPQARPTESNMSRETGKKKKNNAKADTHRGNEWGK